MTTDVKTERLIGKVTGVGQRATASGDGSYTVVGIQEANGKSFDWKTFHQNTFKGLEVGKTYEFEIKRPPNPNGQYPYRNLEGLIGEVDPSEVADRQRANAPASAAGGGGGASSWQPRDETSANAKTALIHAGDFVARFVSSPMFDGKMGAVDDWTGAIHAIAEKHFEWLQEKSRPSAITNPQAPATSRGKAEVGPMAPPFKDRGELMAAARAKFGFGSKEVEKYLSISKTSDIPDDGEGFAESWFILDDASTIDSGSDNGSSKNGG